MKTKRRWIPVLLASAAVAGALAMRFVTTAGGDSSASFPGTDVHFRTEGARAGTSECQPYPGSVDEILSVSDAVVLGRVIADRPNLEQTYGTQTPQLVDGKLPTARVDFISRVLTIEVERAVVGSAPSAVTVLVRGWVADDKGEWIPSDLGGEPRLAVGDRGIFPLIPATGAEAQWAPHLLPCTGVALLAEGKVSQSVPKNALAEGGYYSHTEEQMVAAFLEASR